MHSLSTCTDSQRPCSVVGTGVSLILQALLVMSPSTPAKKEKAKFCVRSCSSVVNGRHKARVFPRERLPYTWCSYRAKVGNFVCASFRRAIPSYRGTSLFLACARSVIVSQFARSVIFVAVQATLSLCRSKRRERKRRGCEGSDASGDATSVRRRERPWLVAKFAITAGCASRLARRIRARRVTYRRVVAIAVRAPQ